MFSNLRKIFFVSIPVFIAHGIEEYVTGFPQIDSTFAFVFRPVLNMSVENGTFIVFQIMVWLLLIICWLLLLGENWQKRLIVIPGVLYIFEFHHIIEAIIRWEYYPGLFTGLAFPIFAFLFWKEVIRNFYQTKPFSQII